MTPIDDGHAVHYGAVERGTPVYGSDEQVVGKVVEVLQASGFHSPLYLMKGELIQQRDFAPRFATRLAEKDQRLAQEAAADQGARMPVNEAVRALLAETSASGRGDLDVAAVADLLFELAKLKR